MIKATFGITKEPFCRTELTLLPQQAEVIDMLKIHAQHGGFSVITGLSGVGKSVIREHMQAWNKQRDTVVASLTQSMQSYRQLLAQLAASLHIEAAAKDLEKELINAAFRHVQANKTIYTVMDEAHLLDMNVLRQLRLLFERFPKKHNLVLLAQPELLHGLAMMCNEDIKSRITYSKQLQPLTDETLTDFIVQELAAVELGVNTFDDGAVQVILRAVQGNLRLCGNLCYASLIQACLDSERIVTIQHVNAALTQPHWRSQDALLKQQKVRELA